MKDATPSESADGRDDLPLISPDGEEVEQGDEIENPIPSRAYSSLPVVALGGSAGSIPAMREFFDNTPPSTGCAYVVVLHLAPEHESTMPALLQRHTFMPVRAAQDAERLTPNTVYVIPPGKHITISEDRLRLADIQQEIGRRVAIDLLFRSLADTHGPHATAIVLSGADSDGAIGLKRIKECGGLTIAQDPQEAEYGGMPGSAIATGMVDWVLKTAEMPQRIEAYHASAARLRVPPEKGPQPAVATAATPDESESLLREVLALLRARTGRDFSYYKRATIVRRIARRMQVTGAEDLSRYLAHMRTNPGEAGVLLQDLLISVTNFFRDREAFDALEGHIQELFRNKKPGESVRVWSAACATGEEVYSIAILLLEHARTMESPPTLQVFGCDLDEMAIQTARSGFYPETIAADVSEERLRNFFVKEQGGYRVRREVREMVLFAAHDLLKDAPFSRMDLVSCRNLLIYLNREAQKRALAIFNFAMKRGGLLFLGASETVQEASAIFAPLDKKHRIFRQRPAQRAGLPLPASLGEGVFQRMLARHERLKQAPVAMPGRAFMSSSLSVLDATADERALDAEQVHFKLLGHFGPASVVVNTEYEVLHLSANANHFLQLPEGELTRNLLQLVHPMLRVDLRAALLRAGETSEPVDVLRRLVDLPGGSKAVNIRVSPGGRLAPGCFLVVFEAHETTGGGTTDVPLASTALEPATMVDQFERELTRADANLRATVEQYEASMQELKAGNEELQAMNEELRSAAEEFETSREELQSLNEELTTVNSELKNRAEELARANSDLHNLMSATQIATVFLGQEMRIMRYTPPAAPLFHLIPTDVGRSIADLKQRLDYPELADDAAQVLRTHVPVERELQDNGRWLLARVMPYRTVENHIAGVVLTFVDITERRSAEEALRASEEKYSAFVETTSDIIYEMSADWSEMRYLKGKASVATTDQPRVDWLEAYIPQEDRARLAEAIRRAIETRSPFEQEHRVIRLDGSVGWAFSRAIPLLGVEGQVEKWFGAASDITERKRAEEALRASEDQLRLIADAMPALISYIDGTLRYRFANKYYETWFGRTPEEIIGTHLREFIGEAAFERLRPHAEIALSGRRQSFEEEVPFKEGGSRHVQAEFVPHVSPDGSVAGYYALVIDVTARKHAEVALRESEEKYRTIFETVDEGFCVFELIRDERGKPVDLRWLEVNPAYEKHTGVKDPVGKLASEVTPGTEDYWLETYGTIVKTGKAAHFENWHEPTGRWYSVFTSRIGGAGSNHVAVLFSDITERKRAEARQAFLLELGDELRGRTDEQSIKEQTVRMLAEHLRLDRCYISEVFEQQGFSTVGPEQVRPDLPPMTGVYQLADYPETMRQLATQAMVIHDAANDSRFSDSEKALLAALPQRALVVAPLKKGAREVIWALAGAMTTPRQWTEGEIALVQETAERTWVAVERARSEASLRASEEQFRRAIEDAPIPVIMHAEDGQVLQISKTWTELTGYTPQDIPTFDAWLNRAYGEGADEVRDHARQLFSGRVRRLDVELKVVTVSGEIRHWSFSASAPGTLRDGRRYIVGMALDITDRKHATEILARSSAELESALLETQRAREEAEAANRTKDRFLAMLSHELRTPLTPVLVAAESILRQKNLSPRTVDGLHMICRNVELQTRLINDLLDLTRISRGTLELVRQPAKLHDVVKAAVEVSLPDIRGKQQQLIVELKAELDTVNADVARTQQVFWNLLKNASKFTAEGGKVCITSRNEPGWIIVEVSDNGIGIDPNAVPHIFEAFRQGDVSIARRFGGLGLGLAISKATIEAHGGFIAASSGGAGEGATFTVKFPLEGR